MQKAPRPGRPPQGARSGGGLGEYWKTVLKIGKEQLKGFKAIFPEEDIFFSVVAVGVLGRTTFFVIDNQLWAVQTHHVIIL